MQPVRFKIIFMIVSGLALLSSVATAQTVTNTTQGTMHGSDIQAAIDNANSGDVIELSNGTYIISNTIDVNKSLTIQGQSEAGVILDASDMMPATNRVIETDADDIALRNFTILPVDDGDPSVVDGFTIKAGSNSVPTINSNLTLENITINGAERTPFDIHGINGVTLTDLTANNTARGNGINVTGSNDVNISGYTGGDNAWGDIGIYASRFFDRPSRNVTIDGPTLNLDDNYLIYSQDDLNPMDGNLINENVSVLTWCYTVTNPDFRLEAPEFTFFAEDLEDANTLAEQLDGVTNSMTSEINDALTCAPPVNLPAMNGAKKAALILIVLSVVILVGYRRLA